MTYVTDDRPRTVHSRGGLDEVTARCLVRVTREGDRAVRTHFDEGGRRRRTGAEHRPRDIEVLFPLQRHDDRDREVTVGGILVIHPLANSHVASALEKGRTGEEPDFFAGPSSRTRSDFLATTDQHRERAVLSPDIKGCQRPERVPSVIRFRFHDKLGQGNFLAHGVDDHPAIAGRVRHDQARRRDPVTSADRLSCHRILEDAARVEVEALRVFRRHGHGRDRDEFHFPDPALGPDGRATGFTGSTLHRRGRLDIGDRFGGGNFESQREDRTHCDQNVRDFHRTCCN